MRLDNGLGQVEYFQQWLLAQPMYLQMKNAMREKGLDMDEIALFDINPLSEDLSDNMYSFGYADTRWVAFIWNEGEICEIEFHSRLDLDYPPMAPAVQKYLAARRQKRGVEAQSP